MLFDQIVKSLQQIKQGHTLNYKPEMASNQSCLKCSAIFHAWESFWIVCENRKCKMNYSIITKIRFHRAKVCNWKTTHWFTQYFYSYRNFINSYTHKMSRIKDIQSLKGCGIWFVSYQSCFLQKYFRYSIHSRWK